MSTSVPARAQGRGGNRRSHRGGRGTARGRGRGGGGSGSNTALATSETHLERFFSRYPSFTYNATASAAAEFYRLCDDHGWDRADEDRADARQAFQDALTLQFNNIYGTDANNITSWQVLCARLGIDPIPDSLAACREAVMRTHVNLVDLVDASDTTMHVKIFPTVEALSTYTKEYGKFFPRYNANAGNLLKFLLRNIMNPELDRLRGERGRGRGARGHRGRGGGQTRSRGRGRGA